METEGLVNHRKMKELSRSATYSSHPESPEDTPTLTAFYTSIVDLSKPCVAVHLGELELRLSPCSLGKSGVADDVAECLSMCRDLCQQAVGLPSTDAAGTWLMLRDPLMTMEYVGLTFGSRTARRLCAWYDLELSIQRSDRVWEYLKRVHVP